MAIEEISGGAGIDIVGTRQRRNSSTIISWFQNIPDKKNCKFLKFDIVGFYTSTTEKLLSAAISFAKLFTQIDNDAIQILEQSKKSLLFNEK